MAFNTFYRLSLRRHDPGLVSGMIWVLPQSGKLIRFAGAIVEIAVILGQMGGADATT